MEWVTIKECMKLTGKSDSTLRSIARKLKESKSKHIKFEKLPTGHYKVLFSLNYVNTQLLISKAVKSTQLKGNDTYDKMIAILENQLNKKDAEIERLNNQLNELTQQFVVKALETGTKRKWWQRKSK